MSILPPPPPNFLKYADNYCVTAKKLILNVSKIRLRLIFSCALYLPRLFAKRPITFSKQHNFFTTNQLSHKTRKKIFRMFFYIETSFRIGTIQSKSGEVQPAELQGKPVLSGCPSSPKTDEGAKGILPLKKSF